MFLLLETVISVSMVLSSGYTEAKTHIVREYISYDDCNKAAIALRYGREINAERRERHIFSCEQKP